MDQSLWQTSELIDIVHSSYMWIQKVLSCGKHCQTMQTRTVSRLRLCGRSWGLKIYVGWNIVRFWKSYICSNKLDVQETNFSFTQFNRIRNHLFGCRIKSRRYSRSWFMGSDYFSPWKQLRTMIERGDPFFALTRITDVSNLEEWSMIWIMLILFPQTSNLRIKKLC